MFEKETRVVRLYVLEEQEIYREIYKSALLSSSSINLLDISSNGDIKALKEAVSTLRPDVLLVSTRKLDTIIIEELKQIRTEFPLIGVVLLLVSYSAESIRLLRNLAARAEAGMAVFLRQSLDRLDQLFRIIEAVSEGQVILDPALTSLMFADKQGHPLLRALTTRELEIMSLLAKGYTNGAIAKTLYIDIRTVQKHINSMYSKIGADAGLDSSDKHPRVSATRLYLEATGELVAAGVSVPPPKIGTMFHKS